MRKTNSRALLAAGWLAGVPGPDRSEVERASRARARGQFILNRLRAVSPRILRESSFEVASTTALIAAQP
jgi:hypothetical protein